SGTDPRVRAGRAVQVGDVPRAGVREPGAGAHSARVQGPRRAGGAARNAPGLDQHAGAQRGDVVTPCKAASGNSLMTSLIPLGAQAALAYFPDEAAALRFAAAVRRLTPAWLVDVVQAYTSVAVFFDLDQTRFQQLEPELRRIAAEPASTTDA